jgi:hypothetical protein
MPSVSKKQHNLMAAVAHNPKFAKKVGIPQSVGKEFNKADKGKQFKRGGEMATNTLKALRANHRNDVKSVNKQNSEERKTLRSSMKEKNATGKDTRKAMQDLRGSQSTRMKEMNAANKLSRVKAAATQENERAMAATNKKAVEAYKKYKPNPNQANKPAPAAKPAAPTPAPEQETMAPRVKALPPAMKKGGKVCGMKAGGVKKELPTAKDLGSMNMKKGGRVKCMAGGGYVRAADGVTKKGKTKGKII